LCVCVEQRTVQCEDCARRSFFIDTQLQKRICVILSPYCDGVTVSRQSAWFR